MINSNKNKTAVHDVLFVDDEALLRETLMKGLSLMRPDLMVVALSNGQQALEAVQLAEFDLVITDLRMPVMDGFTFLEQLRQKRNLPQPKVVVMSVLDGPEVHRRLDHLGVQEVLEKPMDLSRLIDVIDGRRAPASAPARGGSPYAAAKVKRILHMDDDADIRTITHEMLVEGGYRVDGAGSGEEAVERFIEALRNGHPYDVVILDLNVERGMGGLFAARRIREFAPRVHIILATGNTHCPEYRDYQAYGFDLALPKPFAKAQLEDAFLRLVSKGSNGREQSRSA